MALNARIDEAVFLGMVVEFIGTFFLMWAIVGVAVNPSGVKDWAAFTIGATLGLVVMVLAPLTGAGFNPARSFGPALVADAFGGSGDFILVYMLAPVLGALAAAFVYVKLYITPGEKEPGRDGASRVGSTSRLARVRRVTFSRNFTLSPRRTCRCYCKYCAFATHRAHLYSPDEVDGCSTRPCGATPRSCSCSPARSRR